LKIELFISHVRRNERIDQKLCTKYAFINDFAHEAYIRNYWRQTGCETLSLSRRTIAFTLQTPWPGLPRLPVLVPLITVPTVCKTTTRMSDFTVITTSQIQF